MISAKKSKAELENLTGKTLESKPKSIDQQIEDFKKLMREQGYRVDVVINDYQPIE